MIVAGYVLAWFAIWVYGLWYRRMKKAHGSWFLFRWGWARMQRGMR